jgi:hypothetical protein
VAHDSLRVTDLDAGSFTALRAQDDLSVTVVIKTLLRA